MNRGNRIEELQKRLKELDFLKRQEEAKLEQLRKGGEILNVLENKKIKTSQTKKEKEIEENIKKKLDDEEKNKLQKAFKGKSIEQCQKIIKTNRDPGLSKTIIKIGITMGILTITSILVRGIWKYAQKDAKNKRVYDTEQGIDSTKNDNDQLKIDEGGNTPPPEEVFSIEQLEQSIPQTMLHNINYQNIFDAVQNIENANIQKQVITFLKGGDISGLQTFYGMKINSEYTSNKTKGVLDQNILHKIKNPLFGLVGQDVINNPNISDDIKEAYQEFLNGKIKNENKAYLILSKKTCKEYLFDKNNQLIDIQPILIGADVGNKGKFMPYEYYKVTGGKKIYVRGERNRNTPTGIFKVKKIIDLGANYKVDGPKRGINIVPIDLQGNEEERFKYKQWGLAIHPIYQPPSNPEKYEEAIKSGSVEDNSVTHGCPNIQGFGVLYDQLSVGSKVYICTE